MSWGGPGRLQWGTGQRHGGEGASGYVGGGFGGGSDSGRKQNNRSGNATDWRETVRTDRSVAERPKWQLTCYGHERGKDNDIPGDVSPEEVRWANMLAAQNGAPLSQLSAQFLAAERAKKDQFQALTRAQRPPTLGGPPIPAPSNIIQGLHWVQVGGSTGQASISQFGASPFSNPAGASAAFGQPAVGTAGSNPFMPPTGGSSGLASHFGRPSQPTATTFGQLSQLGAPSTAAQPAVFPAAVQPQGQPSMFGGGAVPGPQSGAVGGFGGSFGTPAPGGLFVGAGAAPVFGQQSGSTPFGSVAGAVSPGGTFGAGVLPSMGAAVSPSSSVFGGAPVQQSAPPFGGYGATTPPAMQGASSGMMHVADMQPAGGAGEELDPEDVAAFNASAFQKGKIPEKPPPEVFCQ